MRPLRIGMVGAGMVSSFHLSAWQRVSEFAHVVAICDLDSAKAAEHSRIFAIPGVWSDLDAMLDHERLDAIDVLTPPSAHARACLAAAQRGIAILCQKPLAPTLEEARTLAVLLGERCRIMVHENWRFRPHYRQVENWLRNGQIGEPKRATLWARSSGLLADASGVRPALARQPLLAVLDRLMVAEVLVHHLDLVRWLLGASRVIRARTKNSVAQVAGESMAEIQLELPVRGVVTVGGDMADPSSAPGLRDEFSLTGTEGEISLKGDILTLKARRNTRIQVDLQADYLTSYADTIAHFVHGLHEDREFETPVSWHLEVLKTVEDVYRLAAKSSTLPEKNHA
ncbi:MAG: Gfo/Idh/MocA family oxidoreductase [Ramlibacter sp.]